MSGLEVYLSSLPLLFLLPFTFVSLFACSAQFTDCNLASKHCGTQGHLFKTILHDHGVLTPWGSEEVPGKSDQ